LVRPVNFIFERIFSPLQNARVPDIKKDANPQFFKVLGCSCFQISAIVPLTAGKKSFNTEEKNRTSKFDTEVHPLTLIEKCNIPTAF